jgi:hypothetical protein
VSLTLAGDQVLLLLSGKPDGPVWHSGLSGFPALRLFYPVRGRRVHNGCFLCESASMVVSMARTTLPKEDKAGTSLAEAPWPRHWWPDREISRRMMLLLTMILNF